MKILLIYQRLCNTDLANSLIQVLMRSSQKSQASSLLTKLLLFQGQISYFLKKIQLCIHRCV